MHSLLVIKELTQSFRTPFPSQHGSLVGYDGVRIGPPMYSVPNIPQHLPPLSPKQYHLATTKLELQKTKPKKDAVDVNNNVTEETVQVLNEVEGPALSSKVSPSAVPPSQDMASTLVPVAAGCAIILSVGIAAWSLRHKFCISRKSKEDTVLEIKFL